MWDWERNKKNKKRGSEEGNKRIKDKFNIIDETGILETI